MNKLLQILTLATLVSISQQSQQSQSQSVQASDNNRSEWVAHAVTADGRVRVTITKHKPKLHLPKPQRPVIQLALEDDDTDYYDERPDLQIGYRRPELVDQSAEVHDDLSDEVKLRLVLARKRALEAHARKWA